MYLCGDYFLRDLVIEVWGSVITQWCYPSAQFGPNINPEWKLIESLKVVEIFSHVQLTLHYGAESSKVKVSWERSHGPTEYSNWRYDAIQISSAVEGHIPRESKNRTPYSCP